MKTIRSQAHPARRMVVTYMLYQLFHSFVTALLAASLAVLLVHLLLIPLSPFLLVVDVGIGILALIIVGLRMLYLYLKVLSNGAVEGYYVELDEDDLVISRGRSAVRIERDMISGMESFGSWWDYFIGGSPGGGPAMVDRLSRHATYMAHPCSEPSNLVILELKHPLDRRFGTAVGSVEARRHLVVDVQEQAELARYLDVLPDAPPWDRLPTRFYGSVSTTNGLRYQLTRYGIVAVLALVLIGVLTLPFFLGTCLICPASLLVIIPLIVLMLLLFALPPLVMYIRRNSPGGVLPGYVEVDRSGLVLGYDGSRASVPYGNIERIEKLDRAWERERVSSSPGRLSYPRSISGYALPLHDVTASDIDRLFVIHMRKGCPFYDSDRKGARPWYRVVVDIDHWGRFYRMLVELGHEGMVRVNEENLQGGKKEGADHGHPRRKKRIAKHTG